MTLSEAIRESDRLTGTTGHSHYAVKQLDSYRVMQFDEFAAAERQGARMMYAPGCLMPEELLAEFEADLEAGRTRPRIPADVRVKAIIGAALTVATLLLWAWPVGR